VERDEIGLAKQRVQVDEPIAELSLEGLSANKVRIQHLHPEAAGPFGNRRANPA
jgi:hypothetical protein